MSENLICCGLALSTIDRVVLGKAKPSILTETGFIQEVLREANALRKVVRGSVDDLMKQVRKSTNINWRTASESQRDRVVKELSNLIKGLPTDFAPGISVVLDERGKLVVLRTKKSLDKKFKKLSVDPTFNQVDQIGVDALRETTSMFFGPEYARQGDRFNRKAQKLIADGLEQGLGRREIAADLNQEFERSSENKHYWNTVAGVHVNRARSFSSAATFTEAGVLEYEVVAVLDERTTQICRFMDGRRFLVSGAVEQFEEYEAAENLDDVKNKIMPFMRHRGDDLLLPNGSRVARVEAGGFSGGMNNQQLNSEGIHTPPYHFGCRSTVAPVI